jgi:HlyD family secretion protein
MTPDRLLKTEHSQTHTTLQRSPNVIRNTKRWKWISLIIILVAGIFAVIFIPGTMSQSDTSNKLTHVITRGYLLVSVTEQGTLESSNNTEIKCKVRGRNTVIWVIEGGTNVNAGDELVRLDTKRIEDAISLQTSKAHTARATLERSKAEVEKAKISIPAYLEGSYRSQYESLQKNLKIATTNLKTSQKMLAHSEKMFKRGYVTELEVEGNSFSVTQAELELKVIETQIYVLEKYTKKMELATLNGNLTASKSKLESDMAGLVMDEGRRDLAIKELGDCVIKAEKDGLVIHPSAAAWKDTPDVAEGVTVRKDQVLLLMPDLSKMQVTVGIHESIIDRVKPGLTARITLPEKTIEGKVLSVAPVTRPAGWWTGNVVKYDTVVELPSEDGLKPGMSAEVELIMDQHTNVLKIPVAAVIETTDGDFCWIKRIDKPKRRLLQLGDTDDSFVIVKAGLKEGDEVVLNPLAFVDEAQIEALKPLDKTKPQKQDSLESDSDLNQPVKLESDHAN